MFSCQRKIVIVFYAVIIASYISPAAVKNSKLPPGTKIEIRRVDVSELPKELTTCPKAEAKLREVTEYVKNCVEPTPNKHKRNKFTRRQKNEQRLLKDIHSMQKKYLKMYMAGEKLPPKSARTDLQRKIADLPTALANENDFLYYDRMIDIEQIVIDIMNGREKAKFKIENKNAYKILQQIQNRQLKILKYIHRNNIR